MSGRYDAHIHIDRAGRADRPNFALLQGTQQLDLETQRHVTDLVQKQGAAFGGTEHPGMIAGSAGK